MRAVFLDRDGVLNEAPMRDGILGSPRTLAEFRLLPGITESIKRLKRAGFLAIVATNQPDVARGLADREEVEAMHDRLKECGVGAVYVCYHDGGCGCKKPAPGLLLRAAADHGIDLSASWMVGDQARDVEAGVGAGCRGSVLIDGAACRNLGDATEWILAN